MTWRNLSGSLLENAMLVGNAAGQADTILLGAKGRDLLLSADAAAAQTALALVPGTHIASLVDGKIPSGQLPAIALTATIEVADQATRLALTAAQAEGRIVVQADNGESYGLIVGGNPAVLADWLQVGDRDIARADITDSGAKGRDLLALADDAALQAEILARLVAAAVVAGSFSATGKISTSSTAADSIDTAGGARIAGDVVSLGGGLIVKSDFIAAITAGDLIADTNAGIARVLSVGINTSSVGRFNFQLANSDATTLLTPLSVVEQGIGIRGSLPTASDATDLTKIGGGRIDTFESYRIAGNKVLGPRITGWAAATGTATRTTFATSTVTLEQLAERVKALIDDSITHGSIGA